MIDIKIFLVWLPDHFVYFRLVFFSIYPFWNKITFEIDYFYYFKASYSALDPSDDVKASVILSAIKQTPLPSVAREPRENLGKS